LGLMILTFATLLVNPTKAQDFSDIESSFFQEASTILEVDYSVCIITR